MRTHGFLIRTSAFESRNPKPHFINERCFGEDLAQWLHGELSARGVHLSEPIQEDWGWTLLVTIDDHVFVVSIGVMDDSIGQSPAEWIISVTYERASNRLRHLFRAPDEGKLERLCSTLDTVLAGDPRVVVVERDPVNGAV